jgi:serine/threonine-protein kinase HipA
MTQQSNGLPGLSPDYRRHPAKTFSSALFAWLIADGDMHLKNLALLKIAESGDKPFRSVRVAPLYDAVTTRVFPRLERDRVVLKLNGKDERLRCADFRALASIAGLRMTQTDAGISAE